MIALSWFRPPRHLLTWFLAVALLAVAGLVWLGWRLLQQDRALETQQLQERREHAADLIVNTLKQRLATVAQSLSDQAVAPELLSPDDSVLVVFTKDGVEAHPANRLLYYPFLPTPKEAPESVFVAGEQYEYQRQDYAKAITAFRQVARSASPAIRAGALLRIARNFRKAGQPAQALAAYEELGRISEASLGGVPADLVARRARCALLAQMQRSAEFRREAQALHDDLLHCRWPLERGAFELYVHEARAWLDLEVGPEQERLALAAAVEWLWGHFQKREAGSAGNHCFERNGHTFTLLWTTGQGRFAALVAGARQLPETWLRDVKSLTEDHGVRLSLACRGGAPSDAAYTRRTPADTGLPWTLTVTNANPAAQLEQFAARRRLLLIGLVMAAILVLAGSYFMGRAMQREMAVSRLKSDFVAAVSHEFRTPLASLRQLTENLAEGRVTTGERRQAYYQAQARATSRLSRLVESLLDFGRMEAGVLRYKLEPVSVRELLRTVVDDFEQMAAGGDHHLELTVDDDLPPVLGDPDALTQALWALIDNAVKYSPHSTTIWVEAVRAGERVALRVRDQGIGIPAYEQKDVFRKFVRGSAAETAQVKGTGIGLAMVKHIVQAHQGEVLLESEVGKGTTMTILLKCEAK